MFQKISRVPLALLLLLCLMKGGAHAAYAQDDDQTVLGYSGSIISATWTADSDGATVTETKLGNLVADAFRTVCGADIAIASGGHLKKNLAGGDITPCGIYRIFPDGYEIGVVEITPALLYEAMEYAVSYTAIDSQTELIDPNTSAFDGFPQVSGFSFKYDASQLPGGRLIGITLDGGTKLSRDDGETALLLAAPMEMLSGGMGFDMLDYEPEAAGTEAELMIEYILRTGYIDAPSGDRMSVIGTYSNSIVKNFNFLYFLPYVFLLLILVRVPRNKHRLRNIDGSFSRRYHPIDASDDNNRC